MDRNEAIKRIRAGLKARSGTAWSVTGGKGTGWGWITISSPPSRRTADPNSNTPSVDKGRRWYMTMRDSEDLALLLGLDQAVHCQGHSVSPDDRLWAVIRAERGEDPTFRDEFIALVGSRNFSALALLKGSRDQAAQELTFDDVVGLANCDEETVADEALLLAIEMFPAVARTRLEPTDLQHLIRSPNGETRQRAILALGSLRRAEARKPEGPKL